MTSNALRAQELRETKRNNDMKNRNEREKNQITKRGQNMKAFSDAYSFVGGLANTAAKSLNDFKWYARNEKVAADIASLPWGNRTGAPIQIPFDIFNSMPGILRLNLYPSVGISDGAFSGINIAARQLFVANRSQNTSYTVYEPADYMQYNICLGNIYAAYGMCTLILGLLQTYTPENAYVPKGIINSMGGDFEDLVKNIPSLRAWINNLGYRVENSFGAPADMPYFKRMLMLFSHIYTDTKGSDKGQIYYAWPAGLFRWNETGGSADISLFPTTWNFNSLKQYVENLYSSLSLMESANIMAGDTRKAFPHLFTFPEVSEDHKISLEYDEFMLEQFRNATLRPPLPNSLSGISVVQDNSQLLYTPYISVTTTEGQGENLNYLLADTDARLITVSNPNPTYIDVLEATRWHYRLGAPRQSGSGEYRAFIETCGTEIPASCLLYVGDGFDSLTYKSISELGLVDGVVLGDTYMWLAALKNFKYAPCVDLCVTLSDGSTGEPKFARFMNVDNWAILATETLKFMNDSIMLDEFANRQ